MFPSKAPDMRGDANIVTPQAAMRAGWRGSGRPWFA